MSNATKERKRSALRPKTVKKDHDTQAPLDAGKVVITPLPRRNDDIYMRTLRRRRS